MSWQGRAGLETCSCKIICCNKYLKIQLSETFSSRRGQQATGHGIHQWILAPTTASTALLLRHCAPSRHATPLASPRSGFSFFFSIFFRLTPFSSFFLSWHFHAVAAFCMRRVPSADIVVVVFWVAAVLHFVGCATSGGSAESLPLCVSIPTL